MVAETLKGSIEMSPLPGSSITRFAEVAKYLSGTSVPPLRKAKLTPGKDYTLDDLEPPEELWFRSDGRGHDVLEPDLAVAIVGTATFSDDPKRIARGLARTLAAFLPRCVSSHVPSGGDGGY